MTMQTGVVSSTVAIVLALTAIAQEPSIEKYEMVEPIGTAVRTLEFKRLLPVEGKFLVTDEATIMQTRYLWVKGEKIGGAYVEAAQMRACPVLSIEVSIEGGDLTPICVKSSVRLRPSETILPIHAGGFLAAIAWQRRQARDQKVVHDYADLYSRWTKSISMSGTNEAANEFIEKVPTLSELRTGGQTGIFDAPLSAYLRARSIRLRRLAKIDVESTEVKSMPWPDKLDTTSRWTTKELAYADDLAREGHISRERWRKVVHDRCAISLPPRQWDTYQWDWARVKLALERGDLEERFLSSAKAKSFSLASLDAAIRPFNMLFEGGTSKSDYMTIFVLAEIDALLRSVVPRDVRVTIVLKPIYADRFREPMPAPLVLDCKWDDLIERPLADLKQKRISKNGEMAELSLSRPALEKK